jgi:diacylglycerol kinase (CTP)
MRVEERHKPNGVIWYLLGVLFVLACYPRDVAVLSILILSWADTAASTLGRLSSRHLPPGWNPALPRRILGLPIARSKSAVGFLAAWATGTAVAVGYYGGGPGGGEPRGGKVDWRVLEWRRGVALTGTMVGFVAALTEALGTLTLPLARACVCVCARTHSSINPPFFD